MFGAIQSSIVNTFNWYYVLITSFFVAFCLFLGFSRFGDIKLGHDDDEPEFSLLAVVLAAVCRRHGHRPGLLRGQ